MPRLILGSHDPFNNVDTFRGLPFAQPPVGDLRFRPPQPFAGNFSTPQDATLITPDCIWQSPLKLPTIPGPAVDGFNEVFKFFANNNSQAEDCLHLNVYKPATATPDSKLPVMVWIFGGAFELSGGTVIYDGTSIVKRSMDMGQDAIVIAGNYRTNFFGFPSSKEVQESGNGNLGLLDQKILLEWVQQEVGAFGGDPSRVTLFGESSGAISIGFQMLLYGANESAPLFHGAILESGAAIPVQNMSHDQSIYDNIVAAAECSGQADTLDCLRGKPLDVLLNAITTAPALFSDYASLALAFLPRVDGNVIPDNPANLMAQGKMYRVPTIAGSNNDEGTLFGLTSLNASTTADFESYFGRFFTELTQPTLDGLAQVYPDDPSQGSPFGTGPLFNIGPQYKRISAALGDLVFQIPRRLLQANALNSSTPTWSYRFNHLNIPQLGAFHVSEVPYVFGYIPDDTSMQMQAYWISFANSLDPNNHGQGYIDWPAYDDTYPQIVFDVFDTTIQADDYRRNASDFVAANLAQFPY